MKKIFEPLFLAVLLGVAFTGTLFASEQTPTCSDKTIGISCVVMRDKIGSWHLEEVKPPVGSQNSLVMFTESFQEMPGLFNRPSRARLVFSCIENQTNILFSFGENFMSDIDVYGHLIFKLDDAAPVSVELQASPGNDALGLYAGTSSIRLINQLSGANSLFVSATAFTGRTLTASFQVNDLSEAIKPLRELCNW